MTKKKSIKSIALFAIQIYTKSMDDINIEVKQLKAYDLINVKGVLNFDNCDSFSREIEGNVDFSKIVVLDLFGLEYMDSSGIGAIFQIVKRLEENSLDMYVFNLSEKIEQIFKLVKLTDFVKIIEKGQIDKILKY